MTSQPDVTLTPASDDQTEEGRAVPRHRHSSSPTVLLLAVAGVLLAASILLIVVAYHEAKTTTSFAHFGVFWLGIAAGLGAAMLAALALPQSGPWRVTILCAFGALTYLPKFLLSINGPAYFDEYGHLRHVQDMLATGNLGAGNAYLPVVQYFPGLGVATELVHWVTSLNLWHSGQIVIVVAHTACLPLMYGIARAIGMRVTPAFFVAMVFATNPGYLYFDSQYAYESLAIPLMLLAGWCALRILRVVATRGLVAYVTVAAVSVVAVVLTHHITAIVTAGLLVFVAVFVPLSQPQSIGERRDRRRIAVSVLAGWSVVATLVWVFGVSRNTRSYLGPSLDNGFNQLLDRLLGRGGGASNVPSGGTTTGVAPSSHTPFSGTDVPFYERYIALGLPFVIAALVLVAIVRIWRSPQRWQGYRWHAPFLLFAFGYLASLPLALTASGSQASHRSWPFFYVGVAVVVVYAITPTSSHGHASRFTSRWPAVARSVFMPALALLIMTVGNVSAGANVIYRFPGPFVFGSDNRFDSPELSSVVRWLSRNAPGGAGVVADRFTGQALTVNTRLDVPTSSQSYAFALYETPGDPSPLLRQFLRSHDFRYFVVDERIAYEIPANSFFQGYSADKINRAALKKLSNNSFLDLVYRTGSYRVYKLNP